MMQIVKDTLRQCCLLFGRRNLYRASRFLIRAARGDVENDPRSNGERMVQTMALRTAASPATIFDVGAHVGDWTDALLGISRQLQVRARIHAFEPCSATFAQLSDRVNNWPEVTFNSEACSSRAGKAFMHVYGSGFGINSLAETTDGRDSINEEVRLTTIDRYCEANAIGMIDLLKIDAEGHDFEVIAGASGMLDRQAIRILQFEYNHRWIGSRNYLRDVFLFMNPRGYRIGKLTGSRVEFYPHWLWELENYTESNFIACPRDVMRHFHPREPTWLSFQVDSRLDPKAQIQFNRKAYDDRNPGT